MVVVLSQQKDVIFAAIRAMYTDVARHPERPYHFPTGRDACRLMGYPEDELARLPESAVESFAGVGYPFAANLIRAGDVVLDVGSGSGTDLLIASSLVGERGTVIGLDMTPAMLEKLEGNVAATGAGNVRLLEGNAEQIPLPDSSVDVVTSNGVLNLIPDKRTAFRELLRVLKPGGRLQIADIALARPISDECRSNPKLWAECVVGATLENEYVRLLEEAGFEQVEKLGELDYFSASSSPATKSIARSFGAISLVLRGAKPPSGELPGALRWPPLRSAADAAKGSAGAAQDAAATSEADAHLDARGQVCGELEPVLKANMTRLVSGQVLEILTDDPAARLGLPAWSRLAGHTLLATLEEDARLTRFWLRRR
jgi:ubiquinone/menaquinone biosynthesis C-methylase UbiE/TusA-related sulfurtransferase